MESRGKRILDGDYEQQPERKGPALASVIVEALKVDSLQKLCSSLEPVLRRVVSEEVERALAKRGLARLNGRSSPKRIEGPDGRNLQLQFKSRLSLPLYTGGKVEGERGAAIHVVLVDANADCAVTFGPESSVKLDVVVLEGDFNNENDEDWTQEEFESHVVKEREGKRPLLTGDLQVTLKEGVGKIGELTFTDNSSWIRSQKFRLGLKVSLGFCEGIRIREAKTEAFTVKDHRGELYKKHYPPALNDDVWRLEKIAKDGSFHKRLNDAGISTVEDFLRLVVRDSQRLRTILGIGKPNKIWEALIGHAKTCVLSGKHYVYYPDDTRNVGVVFNNIYELSGLIAGGQYCSADSLTEDQKVFVDSLVKKAYDNWGQFIEYDGKSLLSFKQTNRSSASRNELLMGPSDSLDHQMPPSRLPVSVPSDQSLVNSGLPVGAAAFNDNLEPRYPSHLHFEISSSCTQFDSTSYTPLDQLIGNAHDTHNTRNVKSVGLAHGLPQSSRSGFQALSSSVQASNLNQFDDWSHNWDKGVDDFISEEEIQNLIKGFSMEIQASMNVPEDGYSFPPDMLPPSPNYGYDEDRTFSGKAVVGWQKIKATMRWAFFIRKKAAEKRAQLIELDDERYMLGECF